MIRESSPGQRRFFLQISVDQVEIESFDSRLHISSAKIEKNLSGMEG